MTHPKMLIISSVRCFRISDKSLTPNFTISGTVSEVSLRWNLQIIYHSDKSLGGTPLNTREAIANRILELCKERGITPNALSNISAVPQATIKSILNGESQNPGAVTIKKLCDGFEITLGQFYSTPEFDNLEQEII